MKSIRFHLIFPVSLFCAVSITNISAGEPPSGNVHAGKQKAVLCLGCHGVNGEGREAMDQQPEYPRLAGQIPAYFAKSLYDYKHDKREDPLMNALSKGLTDADIANLAAYYATLD
jgi:cytochrome c553